MSSPTPRYDSELEARVLEGMQGQYRDLGYEFIVHPSRHQLPPFLRNYIPDAIARKPGANIAIEVKGFMHSGERKLADIRKLFDDQPDWQFVVVYGGDDPLTKLTIPVATAVDIRFQIREVASLAAQGQHRAAFLLAWSLIEALAHSVQGKRGRPLSPATALQTLAMLGYLEPAMERRLRLLIELRNRIAHGDLHAAPSAEEVRTVLSAAEVALSQSELG